jgi:hypothetical protein
MLSRRQLVDDLGHDPEVDAAGLFDPAAHVAAHAILLDDGLGRAVPQDRLSSLQGDHLANMPVRPEGVSRRFVAVEHALGQHLHDPADDWDAERIVHAYGAEAAHLAHR